MEVRKFLDANGFIDIETPMLGKSTPEGARDYLVPSLVHAGHFFALPQSPQLFKQLLMVAGFDRYYQIVKCFRDEDLRADRQPEFTQIDCEMSFVEQEDILNMFEGLTKYLFKEIKGIDITEFPRMPYSEAMESYGSDKPDLRFDMHLGDVSHIVAHTEFGVFKNTVESGGKVKAIALPGCAGYSRQELAKLTELAQGYGAKGLLSMAMTGECACLDDLNMDMVKSVAAKYLNLEQVKQIALKTGAVPGDLIVFVADKEAVVANSLGKLRQEMGLRLKLADPDLFAF